MNGIVNLDGAKVARDERRRAQPATLIVGEVEDLRTDIERLGRLLKRTATAAAQTARQQVEMRADLLAAGAFDTQPAIDLSPPPLVGIN